MQPSRTINPQRNRLNYSLGTIGRDVFYTFYISYLLTFIMFTKHLDAGQFMAVTGVMVACRAFDAIIDPFIGGLIENTRSRWGRFKPWIVIGMVLASLAFSAIFLIPVDGWNFIIVLGIANIALSATYSLNDIAYWGMMPALTTDQTERTKLTALAAFCGSVGSALAYVLIPPLTNGKMTLGGSAVVAYPILAVATCVLMMGTQVITLLGAHEPPEIESAAERAPRLKLGDIIRVVVKNDQLLWSSLSIFLQSFGASVFTSSLSVIYTYLRFGYNGVLIPLVSFGTAAGGVVANIFLPQLHKKFGRKKCTAYGIVIMIVGYVFILVTGLLIPPSSQTAMFICFAAGQILTAFGTNLFYLTLLVSIANTVEYNEYKTGNRQEGLIYSVRPFVLQMSSSFTLAVVSAIFLLLGMQNVTDQISLFENEEAQKLITEDTKLQQISDLLAGVNEGRILWLLIALTVIPALLITIGYLIYRKKYFLDEEYYDAMRAETAARNAPVQE
ncbi:MAG: glycoside-pentoside-hexuronide (GPH):cation symporter [Oscillospiraceae bacterium]|jgi:melibiose permease/lactose/raffinose/galactose permease|nr:glycoside-pentoside-hexuronide (GPH):cation symporter [Oscillospiraceae bacterium]